MVKIDLKKVIVKDIMVDEFPVISSDMHMKDVCKHIINSIYTGLPVIDSGILVGFVSEKECLEFLFNLSNLDISSAYAKDYMMRNVKSIHSQTSLGKAIVLFSKNPYHVYPIEEQGLIVGLLFRKDIIKYLHPLDSAWWK
jgi:predicted transcriptional regulator